VLEIKDFLVIVWNSLRFRQLIQHSFAAKKPPKGGFFVGGRLLISA
jgi:hypothetical protein